jgi:hypothetical protein
MNMLKNEENAKYRATIINTLEFDPEILKRFVNFMNNPDEDTAVAQFGKGDKYFGICTLLVTMPGLPMFGHGQIEGYAEKYGMEYRRSYHDEHPDAELINRHEREIFPLMKRRSLFSGSADFTLYDLNVPNGAVNENAFVYSNKIGNDRSFVLYNNSYAEASGWIYQSAVKTSGNQLLAEKLGLHNSEKHFVLLWEQRSSLWFIRSSKEMYERGLFAALKGYQAQVFLNIHEVEDAEQGRWAKINHELNGKGCADIYAALQDMLLNELYEPFAEFLSKENIDPLYKIVAGTKSAAQKEKLVSAYFDAVKEPITRFIKTAGLFLDGAAGRYDPFITESESDSIDAALIWENAKKYLERLINLEKLLSNPEMQNDKTSTAFIKDIMKTIKVKPEENLFAANTFAAIAFAAGYGICIILRDVLGETYTGRDAKLLIDHWHLDRKFRETYESLDIRGDEAWRIVELFKGLLKRTRPTEYTENTPKALAKVLIDEALESSEYKDVLGLNQFEQTIWFNKECFDDALFYASLLAVLENPEAFNVAEQKTKGKKSASKKTATEETIDPETALCNRIKTTAETAKILKAAEKKSAYKLEDLRKALGK